MSGPIEKVLLALEGVHQSGEGWSARCPGHDDGHASLSISLGRGGKVLLHCHAGCDLDTILAGAKLATPDLFAQSDAVKGRIVATYQYFRGRDLICEKVRLDPKDFRCRRPDGTGGHIWNLKGLTDIPLYNEGLLPGAIYEGMDVYVVEGEKDADTLHAKGYVAVTNIGGAGKWPAAKDRLFAGATVTIIADRDEQGYAHAFDVEKKLGVCPVEMRVVESDRAKDITDHFAKGGTVFDLRPAKPPNFGQDPTRPLSTLADIVPTRVQWLWDGYLAQGKLSLLDGDPGTAKSTLALDLIAKLTTGSPMPDRPRLNRAVPQRVILMTSEDGLADTVVPRLMAAGADLSRVYEFCELDDVNDEGQPVKRPTNLVSDLGALRELVLDTHARLLVVDVLFAYTGRGVNTWNDAAVRQMLHPLAKLAEETGLAVLMIRHLNKGNTSGAAIYRGGGSIGIAGAARSVLMAGKDPTDETGKLNVLASVKQNLAAPPSSLSYEVSVDPQWGASRIHWLGKSPVTAERLVAHQPPGVSRTNEAEEFLNDVLGPGPLPFKDVRRLAIENGLAWPTVERAADRLGVTKRREGMGKDHRSTWALPTEGEDAAGTPSAPVFPGDTGAPRVDAFVEQMEAEFATEGADDPVDNPLPFDEGSGSRQPEPDEGSDSLHDDGSGPEEPW